MEKDPDILNSIGRRMPYTVPDGFFENMERDIMRKADTPSPRRHLLITWRKALASIAAAVALLFVIHTVLPESDTTAADGYDGIEQAFSQLSPADQDYLISIYEEDDITNTLYNTERYE